MSGISQLSSLAQNQKDRKNSLAGNMNHQALLQIQTPKCYNENSMIGKFKMTGSSVFPEANKEQQLQGEQIKFSSSSDNQEFLQQVEQLLKKNKDLQNQRPLKLLKRVPLQNQEAQEKSVLEQKKLPSLVSLGKIYNNSASYGNSNQNNKVQTQQQTQQNSKQVQISRASSQGVLLRQNQQKQQLQQQNNNNQTQVDNSRVEIINQTQIIDNEAQSSNFSGKSNNLYRIKSSKKQSITSPTIIKNNVNGNNLNNELNEISQNDNNNYLNQLTKNENNTTPIVNNFTLNPFKLKKAISTPITWDQDNEFLEESTFSSSMENQSTQQKKTEQNQIVNQKYSQLITQPDLKQDKKDLVLDISFSKDNNCEWTQQPNTTTSTNKPLNYTNFLKDTNILKKRNSLIGKRQEKVVQKLFQEDLKNDKKQVIKV